MALETFIENKPRRLTGWLDKNQPNESTRKSYQVILKNWIKCFYGINSVTHYKAAGVHQDREMVKRNVEKRIEEIEEGLERYFNELDDRNFLDDYKTFINWTRNEGYAPLNIRLMSSTVKKFFARQDTRCKISEDDWSDIRRTLIPKSKRASTQDSILNKEQLKTVLHHLSIHGKAMALFLLSTGARIKESCQVKMNDINLDADPPEVNIREEYTKGKVGGRVMWFSYEARDAIIEWHKSRLFKEKPGRVGSYDMKLVFNFTSVSFTRMWNRALKRADGKRVPAVLAKRDPSTKNRVRVYHVHTLRKFFSTKMRIARVPSNVVDAWMGHQGYLAAAYDRQEFGDLSEIYKEHMHVVTVYEVSLGDKTIAEIEAKYAEAERLAKQRTIDGHYIDIVGKRLGAFEDKSTEEIEALSVIDKWDLIINKSTQLQKDAESSSKEIQWLKQMSKIENKGEEG